MTRSLRPTDVINDALNDGLAIGIVQLCAEDEQLDGRTVRVRGRPLLNFASCSYLGLELHPALRQGVIDAVERYGTQFSSSRTYISAPPYEELESLLEQIFEAPVVISASTTLGHLSALPVLIEEGDAVVLDHQVHQSVQLASAQLRLQGSRVELVRHNSMDLLEEKIRELSARHRKVWYLADGVYSMFGEFAPAKSLAWLLSKYEQLHLYIDDAHGMSWLGRHGRGFAAECFGGHDRVVVAVSLNKAFGAAGGAIVFPNAQLRRKVRNAGLTLMFGGPIQPPMLGAAIASARIHLSPEIETLQRELVERIRFTNRTAKELNLPLVRDAEVPIRYIGTSLRPATFDMLKHLLDHGVYMNPAAFPAVGSRRAGIRFMINRHHSQEDIRSALETVAERLPQSLAAAGLTSEDVNRAFQIASAKPRPDGPAASSTSLSLQHARSVRELDPAEWDACAAGRGIFDAATLELFEEVFGIHQPPENRWEFHYFIVRNASGQIVLATFFTVALWKDDLMSAPEVSGEVERQRVRDPYFLTSQTLSMGALLTEGDHLYLDRSADWRGAMRLLVAALEEIREEFDGASVILRDLPADDRELGDLVADADFLRLPAPDSWVIDLDWGTREEYLSRLSRRSRRFQKNVAEPSADAWAVEIVGPGTDTMGAAGWKHLHGLYRNVQDRHLSINTFPLPVDLLPRMAATPGWELMLFRPRSAADGEPRGFAACHSGAGRYDWLLVGMDYGVADSKSLYTQVLSNVVRRAKEVGAARVGLGLGSETMKQRFGARAESRVMYVQSMDTFQRDVLDLVRAGDG